jgi:hypothetical protein
MSRHPRNVLIGGFVGCCIAFAAFPLSIHFKLSAAERADRMAKVVAAWPRPVHFVGNLNKDYGLWYPVGLVARSDAPVYPTDPGVPFPFMYPPFAAAVLAWVSHLGHTGTVVALVLANVAAWGLGAWLSVRLVAGGGPAPPLVWGLPGLLCGAFVYEMFLLGQPNLGLLVLLLAGFHLLRAGRHGWAGAAFATATALKAFPVTVLVYLLWRRHWLAAASMAGVTAGLLLLAPVPTRGWDRNLAELRTWADGMVFKGGAGGVGQRPEQSQGWRNQSLLGVGHRLLRPVDAEADEFDPANGLYVNLLDLDYRTATLVIGGVCLLLGVGFAAVLPRPAARTRGSDACEFAVLTVLVMVGSPYAFGYYFVWLLLPATVLTWFAATGETARVRGWSWAALGLGFGVLALGAAVTDRKLGQAAGAYLWGSLILAGGLAGHLWRLGRGRMTAGGAT